MFFEICGQVVALVLRFSVQQQINAVAELSQPLMHLIVIAPSDLIFPLWSVILTLFFPDLTSFPLSKSSKTDTILLIFIPWGQFITYSVY